MASMIKRSGKWLSKPFKDPVTGKRVTKQFDTQADALAYEEACAEALRKGLGFLPQASTVTDERTLAALCADCLSIRYGVSSPRTRKTFGWLYGVLQRDFGPATPAGDVLIKDTLVKWVAAMEDAKPATRNLYRVALTGLVQHAAEKGICAPFTLRGEKVANQKERYLSEDEEDRLLHHLRDDVRGICRFMLLTGLRISEALDARPHHVQSGVLGSVGKGTKMRRVPLTPEAQDLLLSSGGWGDLSQFIVQDHLRRATAKAGIEGVTPHTLRHTTATRLAQKGINLLQLQQFMGHGSLTTTQRYAHLAPGWGDDVVSLLDNR